MPLQGNGTYVPPDHPIFPAVPGTVIEAGKFNTIIEDIKDTLNKAFYRDGQGIATGNFNLGGKKIGNLGAGGMLGDAVEYKQWRDSFTNAVLTNPTANTPSEAETGANPQLLVNSAYLENKLTRKGNVAGQTWSGTHVFPADTSIGLVSGVELATLNDVSSNIQDQLNTKGNKTGQIWTGNHDYRQATLYVPTLATNIADDRPASTAFVSSFSLEQTLPGQAGNAGKFITTDGTSPVWKALAWGDLAAAGKPNTLAGYGIQDAVTLATGQTITGGKFFTGGTQHTKAITIASATAGSMVDGYSPRRCLQLTSDITFGGAYDDHSGFIMYSMMPGGWGSAQMRISTSYGASMYNLATPAIIVEQSGVTSQDFAIPSDVRLKKNITELTGMLGKIRKLVAISFQDAHGECTKTKLGFRAQQAELVFPEVVSEFDLEGTMYKRMSYQGLIAPLTQAVCELADIVDKLVAERR